MDDRKFAGHNETIQKKLNDAVYDKISGMLKLYGFDFENTKEFQLSTLPQFMAQHVIPSIAGGLFTTLQKRTEGMYPERKLSQVHDKLSSESALTSRTSNRIKLQIIDLVTNICHDIAQFMRKAVGMDTAIDRFEAGLKKVVNEQKALCKSTKLKKPSDKSITKACDSVLFSM